MQSVSVQIQKTLNILSVFTPVRKKEKYSTRVSKFFLTTKKLQRCFWKRMLGCKDEITRNSTGISQQHKHKNSQSRVSSTLNQITDQKLKPARDCSTKITKNRNPSLPDPKNTESLRSQNEALIPLWGFNTVTEVFLDGKNRNNTATSKNYSPNYFRFKNLLKNQLKQ